LGLISRTRRTEPAFVVTFVERVPALRRLRPRHPAPQLAHGLVMKRLGRAHEDVITTMRRVETERGGHLLEIIDDKIGLFLRRSLVSFGGSFDVDAVFVSAGEKECVDALLPLLTRDRVSHQHRVEMTEVRQTVRVIDGCGYVEGIHRLPAQFWSAA